MFDNSKLYLTSDPALLVLGRPMTLAHWRSSGRGPAYAGGYGRSRARGRLGVDPETDPAAGLCPDCKMLSTDNGETCWRCWRARSKRDPATDSRNDGSEE